MNGSPLAEHCLACEAVVEGVLVGRGSPNVTEVLTETPEVLMEALTVDQPDPVPRLWVRRAVSVAWAAARGHSANPDLVKQPTRDQQLGGHFGRNRTG
jgi:hypothetical protein